MGVNAREGVVVSVLAALEAALREQGYVPPQGRL